MLFSPFLILSPEKKLKKKKKFVVNFQNAPIFLIFNITVHHFFFGTYPNKETDPFQSIFKI
jgi:hypothetical protein